MLLIVLNVGLNEINRIIVSKLQNNYWGLDFCHEDVYFGPFGPLRDGGNGPF